jgi:hypothetical protein
MPESRMSEAQQKRPTAPGFPHLVIALVAFGAILTAFVVPGIFTVDENNYLINVLALRRGHVTVTNTTGFSPSRELLFFDPGPWGRSVTDTPVASTAPPLYAFLALPFVWAGWRGLVALNTLSYLATIAMVFLYTRHYASAILTPWVAAATFALGGFSIEYALGLWPHSLSVALCTGGVFALGALIESGRVRLSVIAGFLLALATGVRYQNIVFFMAGGVAIVLWASSRWRTLIFYALAAFPPIVVSSAVNHVRLQSWNPISKGEGYFNVPLIQQSASSWLDPVIMFWARVANYSTRPVPPNEGFEGWFVHDALTQANLMLGIVQKKALLQSAPWAIVSLMLFVLVWLPNHKRSGSQRRQLQILSLVTFAILGALALSGVRRDDGLSFNQRYLLEIVPLAAVAFAFALDGVVLLRWPVLVGGLFTTAVLTVILFGTPIVKGPDLDLWVVRQVTVIKMPLLLSFALGASWAVYRFAGRMRGGLAFAVGCCLAWALVLHVEDDVRFAQAFRAGHLARTQALADVLPDNSAFVAFWSGKDAAGALLFNRDVVILDPRADQGADAPKLIRELLARKRRVFMLDEGFPADVRAHVLSGFDVTAVAPPGGSVPLLELHFKPSSET